MDVKLSIGTPVVTMNPAAHGAWEESATDRGRGAGRRDRGPPRLPPPDVQRAHRPAGRRSSTAAARGTGTRWRPSATSRRAPSASASRPTCSSSPYHHPLELAKRYGTLDVVSGGRVILGVGVGTLKEEFDLIGAPYDDRGHARDDALRALRASLSEREPAYHGDFYDFEGFVVDPCAVQERVPIWVGGRTLRSLRRRGHARRRLVPVRGAARASRGVARRRSSSRRTSTSCCRPTGRLDPINEPGADPGRPRRDRGGRRDDRLGRRRQRDPRATTSSTLEALAAVHTQL